MVTTDLGACEWFVYELRRSNLIDRGQLDQIVGEFLKRNPRAEPPALAEHLVEQGFISAFQAERVLQGKSQGLVLGPYNLIDAIGSGSMGQVYKAVSKTDNQWYAVKVLPRRSMWNVRLARRQVRAFGQFTHPSVVPFVDVGTSGGMHYLVWPLVEGETLEALVQREGKLPPEQAALLGLQIAHGLHTSHTNGLFHGLLKPSNIMIGNDRIARILDFGIGSLLVENEGESLVDTMSTANALTSGLDCASPESIMEPTNRTPAGDQYSLGCVLYFCLTGRYPFPEGSAVEKMMAHQFKQPTPITEISPDVPPPLVEVVDKLMQKSHENRYTDCSEVIDVLQPLCPAGAVVPQASNKPKPVSTLRPSDTGIAQKPATTRPSDQGSPRPLVSPPLRQSDHGVAQRPATPLRSSDPGVNPRPAPSVPTPAPPRPVPAMPTRSSLRGETGSMPELPPMPEVESSLSPSLPPSPFQPPPGLERVDDVSLPPFGAQAPSPFARTVPGFIEEQPARPPFPFIGFIAMTVVVALVVYLLGINFLPPVVPR